ncbi:Mor transcription activator family protein [Fundidesulfovibrio agrisoli]|uniref:Mor transcription activator family protein n=1 Tax=Fundidesulfovibrio agrisoli TaxID=2922717 RepID=UPI001FAB7209|nr:Mor transcription activator family protein [Fundidesulfovibrio agrisoli]
MSTQTTLPGVVLELLELIGREATSELVNRLGGTTFPIPMRKTSIGELRYKVLADVVGETAGQALVERFGGTNLYVPRCAKELQVMRDADINATYVRETNAGRSSAEVVNELARRYRLTDRSVWYILNCVLKKHCQVTENPAIERAEVKRWVLAVRATSKGRCIWPGMKFPGHADTPFTTVSS